MYVIPNLIFLKAVHKLNNPNKQLNLNPPVPCPNEHLVHSSCERN